MRIYAGAALLFVSLFVASVPLLLIGLVLVATGYTGFCPVYAGMEKSTVEE
ncbi:conserved hypothetical protein, membrane or secreted [methanotrophic bacterial endosymbiont of Bathymodiolus sp.]|nr:conserved hypothetical protein, membrane or secreted [methanotrophic bacterial endosymbiont of Bathymodiolus sp.]